MIILEILLTIAAYRRGWKRYALLPGALALLTGFVVGLAIVAGGGSAATDTSGAVFIDLFCIVALIVMACRAPARQSGCGASSPTLSTPVPHEAGELR